MTLQGTKLGNKLQEKISHGGWRVLILLPKPVVDVHSLSGC